MRIKILEKMIANQIAAGEVIERPASVIKELLENSLDAGAKVIEIDIEKSGVGLIRVCDDGTGIMQEDLLLAVAQHATSKIQTLDDLAAIGSLGFRGEALASITSVSELSIKSKASNTEEAWQLTSAGEVMPTAHPQGTTIEVRNLFSNVPVRRKFLKSARTEFSHLEEVVKRIALSAYNVAFHLSHNDKSILRLLPVNDDAYLKRIGKLFGNKFAEQAIVVESANIDLRLWGWVLPEEYSRAHADQQYFFVNGRMVKDKTLQHAIRVAYADVYDQGRYPAYVLYLECDPHAVDVNVHPTKHEVRFHQQRLIHDFVHSSLVKALKAQAAVLEKFSYQAPITLNHEYRIQQTSVAYQTKNAVRQAPEKNNSHFMLLANKFLLVTDEHCLSLYHYSRAIKWLSEQDFASKSVKGQPLLVPQPVSCAETVVEKLCAKQSQYENYGITLQQLGPDKILLRSLPSYLKEADHVSLCNTLADCDSENNMVECFVQHTVVTENPSRQQLQLLLTRLQQVSPTILQQAGVLLCWDEKQLEKLFL
jgi:DNA mismatch repair protein MutL